MQHYVVVNPKDVIKLVYEGVDVHVNDKEVGCIAHCGDISLKELFMYFNWVKKGVAQFCCWMNDEKEDS